MSDWDINFCNNLRYLRQEHGLRKKDMAEILGVSLSTYRKMERCDETVRFHSGILVRVCDHFQVSADAMLRQNWCKDPEKRDRMYFVKEGFTPSQNTHDCGSFVVI